jgi:hypothetical protein
MHFLIVKKKNIRLSNYVADDTKIATLTLI